MKIWNYIKEHYILILILAVAAALRLHHLDFQSVWLDEIHVMIESNPAYPWSVGREQLVLREQQPHLYFLIVRFFGMIFGHTIFGVRFVSVVFGVFGVWAVYLLGKEVYNKKAGYLTAAFLTVNSFHIWYSQEGRPYAMLFFFSAFSFYWLVRFVKMPTYRNATIYGVMAAIMISSHFFGLFVLFAQYLVLLYFLIEIPKPSKKHFFLASLLAGVVSLVLWIPSIPIFLNVTKITSFWIQMPPPEIYTQIFREFFGNSELLIYVATLIIAFYVIRLFNSADDPGREKDIKHNRMAFSFLITGTWILIVLLFPLIRSYLDVPMIVNRYYVSVLPAVILLLGIAVANIANRTVAGLVVMAFVALSMTDLVVVKDYYNKVNKTQFREMSAKIIEKNKAKAKIVSVWAWHFGYFFNNAAEKNTMVEMPFEDYVNKMIADPKLASEPFWYVDAHFHPYKLSPTAEKFLSDNFYVLENLEFFDTWAKYYVPKAGAENQVILDINQFSPIKSDNNVNILLFSNSTTKSQPFELEPGTYRLAIKTRSLPDPPVDNQNAHLTLEISGRKIGAYFLSEKEDKTDYFEFTNDVKRQATLDITFGNDAVLDKQDRNALVFSAVIEKVKK